MIARVLVKINTASFKEWMTATLSVTKADILFQKNVGCDKSSQKSTPFKKIVCLR